jgi:hypothetical protein
MTLVVDVANKTTGAGIVFSSLNLKFRKELGGNQLFVFNSNVGSTELALYQSIYPVSAALNASTYHFDFSGLGMVVEGTQRFPSPPAQAIGPWYPLIGGGAVHFQYHGVFDADGQVYDFHTRYDASGNEVPAGVYANHDYILPDAGTVRAPFIRDGAGNNLSETVPAGITKSITGYSYNVSTGIVKFHYSITIPGGMNSSTYDTTLEGDVEAKVYDGIVSRIGS